MRRGRFLLSCCKFSVDQCRPHCAGAKCSGKCTLTCALTREVCPPVTCETANPSQCTGGVSTDPCDEGYTKVSLFQASSHLPSPHLSGRDEVLEEDWQCVRRHLAGRC